MKADIVIPVWNHLDLTQAAIANVRENTTVPHHLIVVDDGSTDGTAAWLAEQDDLVVITNEKNLGWAPTVNRGIQMASAPYIVLHNNDVLVDKGWLKTMIEGLIENPAIGAIGPLSVSEYKKQMQWEGYFRGRSGVVPIERPGPVSLAFFCTVFRKEVFGDAGLMDERFVPAYGEDNDYAVSMRLAGWGQAIHCDVLVWHENEATTRPAGLMPRHAAAVQQLREKWPDEGF